MDFFSPVGLFADMVTYRWLGFAPASYGGSVLHFFIYDTIKIGILLLIVNYLMAMTRYYFPMEKVRDILTKRRWFGLDYLFAALLGVITPFCSCSSIPLFIGFVSAGIPLGVTFTFLISSPLINEASLYVFPAVFGLKATLLYNVMGIGISIFGGMLIQKLHMEKYIQPEFLHMTSQKKAKALDAHQTIPWQKRMKYWAREALDIATKVFPYVVLGVGVGALIHGLIPEAFVTRYLSLHTWYVIPLATLLGVPLYANSISVIPIAEALIGKGIPMGTVLAFMTATVALSLPEALILKKLMKWPLLLSFFGITTIGIMIIGYMFNIVQAMM